MGIWQTDTYHFPCGGNLGGCSRAALILYVRASHSSTCVSGNVGRAQGVRAELLKLTGVLMLVYAADVSELADEVDTALGWCDYCLENHTKNKKVAVKWWGGRKIHAVIEKWFGCVRALVVVFASWVPRLRRVSPLVARSLALLPSTRMLCLVCFCEYALILGLLGILLHRHL